MNNPLALCELAARAPNISTGHMVKQAEVLNDRVFLLEGFYLFDSLVNPAASYGECAHYCRS